jgi:hypothetical protein
MDEEKELTMEDFKKPFRIPTKKQRKLLEVLPEANSVGEAMVKAGYSKASAKNPKLVLGTQNWQDLLEQYLPDNLLATVHLEGLQATKLHTSHTEPDKEVPDYATRHKYLDTAYKVKNKIVDESKGPSVKMVFILDV